MSNFAKRAKEINTLTNKNNVLANFIKREFKTPSVFTEKGLEKLVESVTRLKTTVNKDEVIESVNALLKSNTEAYINDTLADMLALVPSGDSKLRGKVNARRKDLQEQVNAIIKGSKVLKGHKILKAESVADTVTDIVEA